MVRYGIFLLRPAGRYGIWYWRGVFLATASFQSWGASMKALLGACPSIRDHRFRREFDSVKAAIRSRIFHCGYRSEHRFENSIPWDSAICEYSDRLLVKIIAQNQQYLGVNRAVESLKDRKVREGKLGVFWHTQGAGKSYSIAFFTQKVHRRIGGHFTFLILTDRDDL